jgi:hypothetical protein
MSSSLRVTRRARLGARAVALLAMALLAACGGEQRPAADSATSTEGAARAALPPAVPVLDTVAPAAGALGPLLASALGACDARAADVPPADTLCWHAERRVDFAGDGRPFTVSVDARGPAADSLAVRVRIVRDDTTWYAARWSSVMYGRYDDPAAAPSADSVGRRVDAQLQRLLADSAFRPVRALQRGAANEMQMLRETLAFDVAEARVRAARGLTPTDTLPIGALDAVYARLDSARINGDGADAARVAALAIELRERLAWRFFQGGEHTTGVAWSAAERRFTLVYSCC